MICNIFFRLQVSVMPKGYTDLIWVIYICPIKLSEYHCMAFILKKDRTRTPIKQNISQLQVCIMIKNNRYIVQKEDKKYYSTFCLFDVSGTCS